MPEEYIFKGIYAVNLLLFSISNTVTKNAMLSTDNLFVTVGV
jgi:hypothetical protein